MKYLFLVVILAASTAFSYNDNNYDRDMNDIWLSWCDNNNVVAAAPSGSLTVIKENCANSQKTCVNEQKTQGRYVYYRAVCLDTSKPKD